MALLDVKGLTKHFDLSGGFISRRLWGDWILKAVDHISFSLTEGKTMGLVGESGCGKSTTARLITRLIPATAGEVYFDGKEILGLPRKEVRELRRHVQMVFQDPFASLNPRMKILDIVGRSLTLYEGLQGRKKIDRVAELLEMVGLQPDHVHRYPHEFSGGQRQRIGIARALAARPKLIIADEPVSSLDVSVQAQVLNLFRGIQKKLGLTMIFISHDLNVVGYIADFAVVMYAGKIVEIGPVEQLFRSPLHPYTKGLIAANPVPDPFSQRQRQTLGGEVGFPVNPPPGCRFEPRCPIRVAKCKTEEPPLEEKRPLSKGACHEV